MTLRSIRGEINSAEVVQLFLLSGSCFGYGPPCWVSFTLRRGGQAVAMKENGNSPGQPKKKWCSGIPRTDRNLGLAESQREIPVTIASESEIQPADNDTAGSGYPGGTDGIRQVRQAAGE